MVAVHFGPRPQTDTSASAWLLGVPFGKASILFALVAGVGVAILHDRRPDTTVGQLVWRTAWLLPLGLWLSVLEHPVAVILQYYAVWFLLAALFVRASDTTLLAVALPWLLLGSLSVAWVGVQHPDWLSVRGGEAPGGLVVELLLTGFYPTVTWFPVVLAGMWLGRRDLRAPRVVRGFVVGGTALAAACFLAGHALGVPPEPDSWDVLRSVEGHSEMPLAVIGTAGFGTAVIGLCLWVAARTRLVRPVAAMGEAALSVYVGHLLIWHVTGDLFDSTSTGEAWVTVGWFGLLSALAMWAWLAVFDRGPLETIVRWPFQNLVVPILDMAAGRPPSGLLGRLGGGGLAEPGRRAPLKGEPHDDPPRSPVP